MVYLNNSLIKILYPKCRKKQALGFEEREREIENEILLPRVVNLQEMEKEKVLLDEQSTSPCNKAIMLIISP